MGFDSQFLVRVRGSFLAITAFKHQYTFPFQFNAETYAWESLRDNTEHLRGEPLPPILPPPQTTPDTLLSFAADLLASSFSILTEEQLLCLPHECFTIILHHLPPNTLLHLRFDSPTLREHFHAFVFSLQAELFYEGMGRSACCIEKDLAEEMTKIHPDVSVELCIQDECLSTACEAHFQSGHYRSIVAEGTVEQIEEREGTLFPLPAIDKIKEEDLDDEILDWSHKLFGGRFFPRTREWTRFGYSSSITTAP